MKKPTPEMFVVGATVKYVCFEDCVPDDTKPVTYVGTIARIVGNTILTDWENPGGKVYQTTNMKHEFKNIDGTLHWFLGR